MGEILMRFRGGKRANLVQSLNQKISPYTVITKRFLPPPLQKAQVIPDPQEFVFSSRCHTLWELPCNNNINNNNTHTHTHTHTHKHTHTKKTHKKTTNKQQQKTVIYRKLLCSHQLNFIFILRLYTYQTYERKQNMYILIYTYIISEVCLLSSPRTYTLVACLTVPGTNPRQYYTELVLSITAHSKKKERKIQFSIFESSSYG